MTRSCSTDLLRAVTWSVRELWHGLSKSCDTVCPRALTLVRRSKFLLWWDRTEEITHSHDRSMCIFFVTLYQTQDCLVLFGLLEDGVYIWFFSWCREITLGEKGKQLQTGSYTIRKRWGNLSQKDTGLRLCWACDEGATLTRNDLGRCRLRTGCPKSAETKAPGHFCVVPGRKEQGMGSCQRDWHCESV